MKIFSIIILLLVTVYAFECASYGDKSVYQDVNISLNVNN
jgi:hypothetical protein